MPKGACCDCIWGECDCTCIGVVYEWECCQETEWNGIWNEDEECDVCDNCPDCETDEHCGDQCCEYGICVECPSKPGACCIAESFCEIVLEEECLNWGGVFLGEETTECDDCSGGGGWCCVPQGTPSDIISIEHDIFLADTLLGGDPYPSGCESTYCFPADSCCRTGMVTPSIPGFPPEYRWVGITQEECGEIGGAWFADKQECEETGCEDLPDFDCLCCYYWCEYEEDQTCGFGRMRQVAATTSLPSAGSGYSNESSCRSLCLDSCENSESTRCCAINPWCGTFVRVCSGDEPANPDNPNYTSCHYEESYTQSHARPPCYLGECPCSRGCCSFADSCNDQNSGLDSCVSLCLEQSGGDTGQSLCGKFGGVWMGEEDCPAGGCPCP